MPTMTPTDPEFYEHGATHIAPHGRRATIGQCSYCDREAIIEAQRVIDLIRKGVEEGTIQYTCAECCSRTPGYHYNMCSHSMNRDGEKRRVVVSRAMPRPIIPHIIPAGSPFDTDDIAPLEDWVAFAKKAWRPAWSRA